jgi:hypothetical protein
MHGYYHPFPFLFGGFFLVLLMFFFAIHIVLFLIPGFLIIRKAGFSGWWVLLTYVPFGLPVGMWILATATWPVEQRAWAAAAPVPTPPPPTPPTQESPPVA